ncbi:hypothetical protein BDL97_06G054600 [Sphagnum fallax]|nr:hypothetical protein BDL97_06G054600 [Sphagnum fallax]
MLVYIDEFLLHPDVELLIAQDETVSDSGSSIQLCGRSTLEATLAHVLLSFLSITELDFTDFTPCLPKNKIIRRSCELSLQAGVLLLDSVINDDVPQFFLGHVINMVSGALEAASSMPTEAGPVGIIRSSDLNSVQDIAMPSRKWFTESVTARIFQNKKVTAGHVTSAIEILPPQAVFSLASAVLETAVSLHANHISSPQSGIDVKTFSSSGQNESLGFSRQSLELCLLEYIKLGGLLSQKLQVALEAMMKEANLQIGPEQPNYHTCCDEDEFVQVQDFGYRSEHGHECDYSVPKQEDKSGLVASALHLMSSALDFITGFAYKLSQEAEGCAPGDMTSGDLHLVFLGITGAFSKYIPESVDVITPGAVGHALVVFADILFHEVENNIPEGLLLEYFHLLESLVIVLLMEDKWRRTLTESTQVTNHQSHKDEGVVQDKSCIEMQMDHSNWPDCYVRHIIGCMLGVLGDPHLDAVLGDKTVPIILQINTFLNELCEFMDMVLLGSAWRESIPISTKHLVKSGDEMLQEEKECTAEPVCVPNTLLEGRQLRPSTLPIIQKLTQHRSSPKGNGAAENKSPKVEAKGKHKQLDTEEDVPAITVGGNPFVTEIMQLEKNPTKDSFDDLNDFIVCKKGRIYSKWLNQRTKFRRRQRTRGIWKRLSEKRKLLSMLQIV